MMNTTTIQNNKDEKQGQTAAILGIVFGLISIFVLGMLFVPLATVCAGIGLYRSIRHKYMPAIGMSVLAFILTLVGLFTSPSLLLLLGFGLDSAMR